MKMQVMNGEKETQAVQTAATGHSTCIDGAKTGPHYAPSPQGLRERHNQAAGYGLPAVQGRETPGPEPDKVMAAVAGHDSPAVRERKTPYPEQN